MLKASDKTDSHKREGHWFNSSTTLQGLTLFKINQPDKGQLCGDILTWKASLKPDCVWAWQTEQCKHRKKERGHRHEKPWQESTALMAQGREWMNNPPALDASCSTAPRACSAGCAQLRWGSPCKYRGYSQKFISFYTFVPADFDRLMKKGGFQKLFYSLFKNATTFFHKVLRGQSLVNLELQRKAQTLKYQRQGEILHTAT